jgi:hypothetical protein
MDILLDHEIKDIIKKYEQDTVFNNEVVHMDVLKLVRTINFYKKQVEILKKTRLNNEIL